METSSINSLSNYYNNAVPLINSNNYYRNYDKSTNKRTLSFSKNTLINSVRLYNPLNINNNMNLQNLKMSQNINMVNRNLNSTNQNINNQNLIYYKNSNSNIINYPIYNNTMKTNLYNNRYNVSKRLVDRHRQYNLVYSKSYSNLDAYKKNNINVFYRKRPSYEIRVPVTSPYINQMNNFSLSSNTLMAPNRRMLFRNRSDNNMLRYNRLNYRLSL